MTSGTGLRDIEDQHVDPYLEVDMSKYLPYSKVKFLVLFDDDRRLTATAAATTPRRWWQCPANKNDRTKKSFFLRQKKERTK